ncbi:MAG: hypothetical protein ACKOTB_11710, partial [Planctomycetia bacterium]
LAEAIGKRSEEIERQPRGCHTAQPAVGRPGVREARAAAPRGRGGGVVEEPCHGGGRQRLIRAAGAWI